MYPIFVRIAAKKEKAYIKTMYEIPDLSQWYNGKVVARTDAAMMNKRLLFELKKYNDRVNAIENNDTYTATQLKLIVIQADKVAQNTSTFTDFFRKKIEELKKDGRENYAKMHEETLRIFLLSEGEAPFVIMNHITVEHFDTYMKRKGYSDGNRNIRLSHIKARVNEAIKYGLIKCEKHPFAYTKLPTSVPKDLDISITDFIKIRNADTNESKRLTLAKDIFLLSFYTGGINLADIVKIDFSGNEISYTRQKSKEHKRKDKVTRIAIVAGNDDDTLEELHELGGGVVAALAGGTQIQFKIGNEHRAYLLNGYVRYVVLALNELGKVAAGDFILAVSRYCLGYADQLLHIVIVLLEQGKDCFVALAMT